MHGSTKHVNAGGGNKIFAVKRSPFGECVTRTGGDVAAGALLYRVQWWHSHSQFQRDEKTWVVLTREEWMTDLGYSRHQYDRALSVLKRLGLVVVVHGKLRRTDRHTRAFIRPQVSVLPGTVRPHQLSDVAEIPVPELSAKPECSPHQLSDQPDDKKGSSYQQEKALTGVLCANAKEGTRQSNDRRDAGLEQAKDVWNLAMAGVFQAKPVAFLPWQQNRLREALDYLGQHLPETDPLDVIRVLITRWDHFKDWSTGKVGPKLGDRPDAGTVRNYINVVADWYRYDLMTYGAQDHQEKDAADEALQLEAWAKLKALGLA